MAMEMWGKWFSRDIDTRLGINSGIASRHEASHERENLGFDAHSWLRVCAVPCAVHQKACASQGRRSPDDPPLVQPCFNWLHKSAWHMDPLIEFRSATASAAAPASAPMTRGARGLGYRPADAVRTLKFLQRARKHPGASRPATAKREGGRVAAAALTQEYGRMLAEPTAPATGPRSYLSAAEVRAAQRAATFVTVPAVLAAAANAAASLHPRGLIALAHPIASADRREYQIYVHILMSAAMLTQRKPVLPLARCSAMGEWSSRSRCIYVMHAAHPNDAEYCVQRPPSVCHGKVALPNELEGVASADVGTVTLPSLPLISGNVDIAALGAALGAQARDKRVLLLDTSALKAADDLSSLLVTPKGWLCTLEHKSCQHAC